MNCLAILLLWHSRLATIVSPREFGSTLTSYYTHHRTSNFPQTTPIVGSRFSNRAHYNECVENGSKSWALMRRRLVSEVKNTKNRTAQRPKEKGPLTRGRELPTLLASQEPPSFLCAFLLFSFFFTLGDLCCYISLSSVHPPPTLVSHPCPYSSAHPMGHSFWHSVSYFGPHRTV